MDVWFYEAFEEEEAGLRALLPAGWSAGFSRETAQEAAHAEPPARVLSTRTQSRLPLAWKGAIDAVISRSTGYDHLLALRSAWGPGAPALGHLPEYCAAAVAEHAILAVMALLRRVPLAVTRTASFARSGLTGREAAGRSVAVFGVGRIGAEVVRLASALGMRPLGVDVDPGRPGVEYVSPEQALARADAVVCAMDLNPTSRGYFGPARVAALRPGAVFVNVSRGELASCVALLDALRAGRLGGVALDVYPDEDGLAVALRAGRPPTDLEHAAALELARHPLALCTPHNAFNTEEAVGRKCADTLRQLVSWRESGALIWPVPARLT